MTAGPSKVGGSHAGRSATPPAPRTTSRAPRGRTAACPRRPPCRARIRRSAGIERSPWAAARGRTRAHTSGSWSRTQTSFGAVNPVSASLPVISMRRSGPTRRADLVARVGCSLVVPQDRRSEHGSGRVEQHRPCICPVSPTAATSSPAIAGLGQGRSDRPPRSRPTTVRGPARSTAVAGSRSRTRPPRCRDDRPGLVDEDGLRRGRRDVDADDEAPSDVSGRPTRSPG